VWGTDGGDNIVWGTAADGDNIVWGTASSLTTVWIGSPDGVRRPLTGDQVFDRLGDRQLLELLEYAPPPVLVTPPLPEPIVTDLPPVDAPVRPTTIGDGTMIPPPPPPAPDASGTTTPAPIPSIRPGGDF